MLSSLCSRGTIISASMSWDNCDFFRERVTSMDSGARLLKSNCSSAIYQLSSSASFLMSMCPSFLLSKMGEIKLTCWSTSERERERALKKGDSAGNTEARDTRGKNPRLCGSSCRSALRPLDQPCLSSLEK